MGLKTRLLLLPGLLYLLSNFVSGQSGQSFYYFYRPNQPMFVNSQTYGTERGEQTSQTSYTPSPASFTADYQHPGLSINPTRIRQQAPATYAQQTAFEQYQPELEKVGFANQPRRVGSTVEPSARFPSFFDQPFQYFQQKSNVVPQQQYYTPQQSNFYEQQIAVSSSTPLSATRPQQYFNYRIIPPTAQAESVTESRNINAFGRKPISNSIPLADPVPYEFYSTVHNNQGSNSYSFAIGTDKNAKPTASVSVNLGQSIYTNDGEPYEGHTQRLRAIANSRGEISNNYNSNVVQNEKNEQDEMEKLELHKVSKVVQEQQDELLDTVVAPVTSTATSITATTVETETTSTTADINDDSKINPDIPLIVETTSNPRRRNKNKKVARKRIRVRGRNNTSTVTKKESDEPLLRTQEDNTVPPEVTTVISISTTTEKVVTTTVAARRPSKPGLRRRIKITPELVNVREPTSTNSIVDTVDSTTIRPSPVIQDIINTFPQPSTKIAILPEKMTTTTSTTTESPTTTSTTTEVPTTTSTTTESLPEITSKVFNDDLPSFDEPVTTVSSTTEKNVQTEIFTTKQPETVTVASIQDEVANYSEEEYDDYELEYPESEEIVNDDKSYLAREEVPMTTPAPIRTTPSTSTTTEAVTTTRPFRIRTTPSTSTTTEAVTTTRPFRIRTTPSTSTTTEAVTTTRPYRTRTTASTTTANYESTEAPTERSISFVSEEKQTQPPQLETTTEKYFEVEPLSTSTTEKPFELEVYTTASSTTEKLPEAELVFDENMESSTADKIVEHIEITAQPRYLNARFPFESTTISGEASSTDPSSTTTSTTEQIKVNIPDYDKSREIGYELSKDSENDETPTAISSTTEKDTKLTGENDLGISSEEAIYSDEYDSEIPSDSEEKIGQAQRLALENTLKKLRNRVRNSTSENPLDIISSTVSSDGDSAARKFIRKPVKISDTTNTNSNRAIYNDDGEDSDINSRSQIIQKIQSFRTKFVRVRPSSANNGNKNSVRTTTKRPRRVTRPGSRLILNQVTDNNYNSANSKIRKFGSPDFGRNSNVVAEKLKPYPESATVGSLEVTVPEITTTSTTTTIPTTTTTTTTPAPTTTTTTTTPAPTTTTTTTTPAPTTTTTTTTTEAPRPYNPPTPESNSFEENHDNLQKNVDSHFDGPEYDDEPLYEPISTTVGIKFLNTESTTSAFPIYTTSETPSSSITHTHPEETNDKTVENEPPVEDEINSDSKNALENTENGNDESENQASGKLAENIENESESTPEKIAEELAVKTEGNKTEEVTGKPFVKGRVTKIRRKLISRLIIHEILPTPGPVTTTTTTTTTTEAPTTPSDISDPKNPRVRRLRKKTRKEHTNIEIVVPDENTITTEKSIFSGATQTILNSTSVVISSIGDEEDIIFTTPTAVSEEAADLPLRSDSSSEAQGKLIQPNARPMKIRRVLKKRKPELPPPAPA